MQILAINNEKDFCEFNKNAELFGSGSAVALGFFDGVHIAHRKLIGEAVKCAKSNGIPSSVLTFSASDASFKSDRARLLTDNEKLSEFQSLGVDIAVVFNFELIKNISPEMFVEKILIEFINAQTAFCGYNFRFGKDAAGDSSVLESKMKQFGRSAVIIPEFKYGDEPVSSSAIRNLISSKELHEASRLLGKPFFADGTVLHGLGLGKKLGFPTVNTGFEKGKLMLPNGVYFTAVKISGRIYPGITNVGSCPTFDERQVHAETFIFDFKDNIYDKNIRIFFIEFIRNEIKFLSPEELIMQINIDKTRALVLKEEIKWQEIGPSLQ